MTSSFKIWLEGRKQKINPQQLLFDFDTPDIEVGDEVVFTPHDTRYEKTSTGFITEKITGITGEVGYHLQTHLETDPQRTIRLWTSRGTFKKTGKVAPWKSIPEKLVKPKEKPQASEPLLSERNVYDLAADYKAQGMDRQSAWRQYVKDTILQPRYRSDKVDAPEFFSIFDKVTPARK